MWREHLVARLQTRLLRHWGISPRGRPLLRVLRAVDTEGDGVKFYRSLKKFLLPGPSPEDVLALLSVYRQVEEDMRALEERVAAAKELRGAE